MAKTLLKVLAVLIALALPFLMFYPNLEADSQAEETATVGATSDAGSPVEAGTP